MKVITFDPTKIRSILAAHIIGGFEVDHEVRFAQGEPEEGSKDLLKLWVDKNPKWAHNPPIAIALLNREGRSEKEQLDLEMGLLYHASHKMLGIRNKDEIFSLGFIYKENPATQIAFNIFKIIATGEKIREILLNLSVTIKENREKHKKAEADNQREGKLEKELSEAKILIALLRREVEDLEREPIITKLDGEAGERITDEQEALLAEKIINAENTVTTVRQKKGETKREKTGKK